MYDWSGVVPANAEQGQPTGLLLKAGDVISVVARGWIKYGYGNINWAAPEGTMPVYQPAKPSLSLIAKIANKTYKIGNGVLRRRVPIDGELILLFDDSSDAYGDNSGEFSVDIIVESSEILSSLEEINR
ncbi:MULTISPECIES: LecA/PA-IL family lectin [Xenorhabdus]|uniref:LecA/PA-IL family lectin n=1 Tax=Xenorhabdus TaxID=626 RepID=UPI00064AE2A4|nr:MULTISPECIES: LecA/PA-IL family lectin [Xenorhabdus]KLU16588.1 lectin [Xenorhabdus griffiniae]KOP32615.1 lectin [Xenorhabdus sp. GDc328]WFQ80187.1 LecA/PA-IL family lectin [Xenorhabdus sp. SF857]